MGWRYPRSARSLIPRMQRVHTWRWGSGRGAADGHAHGVEVDGPAGGQIGRLEGRNQLRPYVEVRWREAKGGGRDE